ncbi:MAG: hypothetical protein KBE65_11340 [Phycisphaerae bacterium]|nr:hypothetical protein [Phycisphaerae bacterium]
MNKFLSPLVVAVVIVLMPAGLCSASLTQLFAYYPFSGNALDATGGGHDGTVCGATLTTDRFGNPNSAYNFDGDDCIEIANPADFGFSGSFKVDLWATFADNTNVYRYLLFMGEDNSANGPRFALAKARSGLWDGRLYAQTISPKTEVTSLSAGDEVLDNWHHLVAIVDQQADTLSFYVDDVLQGTRSIGGFTLEGITERVLFGCSSSPYSPYPDWHKGQIDDVAIYIESTAAAVPAPGAFVLAMIGVLCPGWRPRRRPPVR